MIEVLKLVLAILIIWYILSFIIFEWCMEEPNQTQKETEVCWVITPIECP